jgi:plastocyanin
MQTRRLIAIAGLTCSAVASATALAADQTVTATSSNDFVPAAVSVNQGETVTWVNAGGDHNVKFDDGSFEQPSQPSASAWTVARRFDNAGTFRYYCEAHGGPGGAGMSGTVTVQASATTPGGPVPPPPPPAAPPPPAPPPATAMRVTLRVDDARPKRGQRVRFFGSVQPPHDGRVVRLQRRGSGGRYRTVARARLRDAGDTRSTYSRRLRIFRDGIYRARVPADGDHLTGTSRRRRVDVR